MVSFVSSYDYSTRPVESSDADGVTQARHPKERGAQLQKL